MGMSKEGHVLGIKNGVACAIQALDGTRARRSLMSKLTDAHAWASGYLAKLGDAVGTIITDRAE